MRGKRKKSKEEKKKETYKVGEKVTLQDIKSKVWNTEGVVIEVRTIAQYSVTI